MTMCPGGPLTLCIQSPDSFSVHCLATSTKALQSSLSAFVMSCAIITGLNLASKDFILYKLSMINFLAALELSCTSIRRGPLCGLPSSAASLFTKKLALKKFGWQLKMPLYGVDVHKILGYITLSLRIFYEHCCHAHCNRQVRMHPVNIRTVYVMNKDQVCK